jgi:hypothetical protein
VNLSAFRLPPEIERNVQDASSYIDFSIQSCYFVGTPVTCGKTM